jgi:hypothetical protein
MSEPASQVLPSICLTCYAEAEAGEVLVHVEGCAAKPEAVVKCYGTPKVNRMVSPESEEWP